MENFSIIEPNINKLNQKIAEFKCREGYEPYIFASKETFEILTKPIEVEYEAFLDGKLGIYKSKSCSIGKYQGKKVFEDDTLKFGEIMLR